MSRGMVSLAQVPSAMSIITLPRVQLRSLKLLKPSNLVHVCLSRFHSRHPPVCCTKLTEWEPSPSFAYAPSGADGQKLLKTANIFETASSENAAEAPVTKVEELIKSSNQQAMELQFLKWPMWIVGPSLLLATGMVPTLWLPLSSIFLGPNIASLLSLVGLDCIFNLGATLFLLMADSCARPKNPTETCKSKVPFSYQFWNLVATVTGLVIPILAFTGSQNGFLQPHLPFISFAVLLGPYLLLLSVQVLTEILTWHWQSPVWLVTPVIYEAYRVLQLMRALKLSAELSAPTWMLHSIRGLVSWWILILGMQLMRVAWFAGLAARTRIQHSYAPSVDQE